MYQDRQVIEERLSEVIKSSNLKSKNNKTTQEIKAHLLKNYQIFEGDVQSVINDPDSTLSELDLRFLILLLEQVHQKTGKINPSDYFTEAEMKEARQYSGVLEQKENEIDFPLTINNATVVGNDAYMVTMDIKTIDKLIENQLLNYNFEVQREAKIVKRRESVILVPTVNKNNVKEIANHLLENTLVPSVLVFNAATRTAESGTELVYDPKHLQLTIEKGTRLDIVDGYHRCLASQRALQSNPELSFNFAVMITNFNMAKVKKFQAQIAKATPISKVRIQELEANRLSDKVVQQLREESDLKGRISQTNRVHTIGNELVSYNVLADTIDEMFELNTRIEAEDTGEYLVKVFNYLLDEYKEEFIVNPNETRKTSLLVDNNMFVGYIVLASRLFKAGMKPRKFIEIIRGINFNKDNPMWQEIGVLDEGHTIQAKTARKAIKDYFNRINIDTKEIVKG